MSDIGAMPGLPHGIHQDCEQFDSRPRGHEVDFSTYLNLLVTLRLECIVHEPHGDDAPLEIPADKSTNVFQARGILATFRLSRSLGCSRCRPGPCTP